MSQRFSGVKGMNDLLPPDINAWHFLESQARDTFRHFGFQEIRTPVLEDTALFVRSVGEATDIVGKEMYTFQDRAGRSLSLRPENTAPAVRAYIEHAVHVREAVTRWYYLGPMFRYERMKTGRYRQFWQTGAEAYGSAEPAQDAELIDLGLQLIDSLGLQGVRLELNSLGDENCRPAYLAALSAYLRAHQSELCAECQQRLERNPLRVLDCKNPKCQAVVEGAPLVTDALCQPCRAHFDAVQRKLAAIHARYTLNPRMVRGLDYYTRTAFEFLADAPALGTATAVGGGGRYDRLVQELGGPPVPAVGWAMGMDRLCLLLAESGKRGEPPPELFVAVADAAAQDEAFRLVSVLRRSGHTVDFDPRGGSLKSQMKRADKSGARFALVLGERELASGEGELKPLGGGEAVRIRLDGVGAALAARRP
ncbi:MAG: histidine--tRNA ligase [Myxococcaceae bacterium]